MTDGRLFVGLVLSLLVHLLFAVIFAFLPAFSKVDIPKRTVINIEIFQTVLPKPKGKTSVEKETKKPVVKASFKKVSIEKKSKKSVEKRLKYEKVSRVVKTTSKAKKKEILVPKKKLQKKLLKKVRKNKSKKKVIRKVARVKKIRKKIKKKSISEEELLKRKIEAFRQEKYLEKKIAQLRRIKEKREDLEVKSRGATGEIALSHSSSEIDPLLFLYLNRLISKLRFNWALPEGIKGKEAVVDIKISKNGRLLKLGLEKSSGDVLFDESCLRAVRKTFPFDPLPEVYDKSYLEIGVRFKR